MATHYDEQRTDVKESQSDSLEALKSVKARDVKSVVLQLDETDVLDGLTPGGEFTPEELVVQVIPQADNEFTCCFTKTVAEEPRPTPAVAVRAPAPIAPPLRPRPSDLAARPMPPTRPFLPAPRPHRSEAPLAYSSGGNGPTILPPEDGPGCRP